MCSSAGYKERWNSCESNHVCSPALQFWPHIGSVLSSESPVLECVKLNCTVQLKPEFGRSFVCCCLFFASEQLECCIFLLIIIPEPPPGRLRLPELTRRLTKGYSQVGCLLFLSLMGHG